MKIKMNGQIHPLYSIVDRLEHSFITRAKHLRESGKFFKREVLSRILAVVSPIFFALLFSLKVIVGAWSIGASLFNQRRTIATLKSITFTLACALLALPCGIINPGLLAETPRTVLVPLETSTSDRHAIATQALANMSSEEMDQQWQLSRFFGNIRVISLDRSTERFKVIGQQLATIGVKPDEFSRFRACLGADLPESTWSRMVSNYLHYNPRTKEGRIKLDKQHMGETGCYMSHYQLIKETAQNYNRAVDELKKLETVSGATDQELAQARSEVSKYSTLLVLEDDNAFERVVPPKENPYQTESDEPTQKGNGRLFYEAMRDLPDDWDMLYFSTLNFRAPLETTSSRLLKLTQSVWLNAYAVNAKMYPKILKQLEKIETSNEPLIPVDDALFALHPTTNSFVTNPALATQGADSVIHGRPGVVEKEKRKQYQSHLSY